MNGQQRQKNAGLYRPSFEHDNCGIGAVVNIKGIKSHKTVEDALSIVENLEHRAGKDAEGKTGDGVGIMVQISHKFFSKECAKLGIELGGEREYGIGMFFLPQDELKRNQAKKMFEIIVEKEGMNFLGWREVTTNPKVLGSKALEKMPSIMQAFIQKPEDVEKGLDFDRKLYIARRVFEQSIEDTYVVSCSSRTLIYKGMFLVGQLRSFFQDLQSPDYESAIALVHSRFSTNTMPSWERAHPYRFLVHNGEINTIKGNADKMLAREETVESEHLKGEFHKILPVISASGSDSAMLDNTLEFLVMSGMDLALAVMILIPEPWLNNRTMSQKKKDFYQYYATMMEPWDGPASILFTDGDVMGAVLDRNGLRPSRYYVTTDDQLILSSEVGVLDIDPSRIVEKERLHPGKMLLVDTKQGKIIDDDELKEYYANRQPYGEWLDHNLVNLSDLKIPNQRIEEYTPEERARLQKAFGYNYEDVRNSIMSMASNGSEATSAMGIDVPLAVLSEHHQPLFNYFKQLFAQVTNPPIDAIREKIVTSTTIYVGKAGNLLEAKQENCCVMRINNPILTETDLLKIKNMKEPGFKVEVLPIIYYKNTSLEKAIDRLFVEADRAYRDGVNILILSDRGVDENHVAIPSLLAVSALQQHLVRTKKRTSVSIILESGEPREVHHFATLLGYGACAVNPYLAHESIHELIDKKILNKDYYAAVADYDQAVINGIVKIASKMGISTIQSYLGSKIFEAIGINKEVVDRYFTNTVSRIGGIGLEEIGKQVELTLVGSSTELDKSLIERIIDPLTHLVRNSLDHGIELPEKRLAAGKNSVGNLILSAEHQGGNICIEVTDDGAGLNRERILAKAASQGLTVSENMSDDEVAMLIFAPGFSTAEQVTDVSGRGVGMDVVKRNIQEMGGHVEIQSKQGTGTTIRILLPLTLAILDGMSVRVADEVFILPLNAVMESLQPREADLHPLAGGERVLEVRGEYLPIVELWKVFNVADAKTEATQGIVVILQSGGRRYALLVDQLIGQHQVVVKNLESNYRKVPGISAATILGDGSVALIVDVSALQAINREQRMANTAA